MVCYGLAVVVEGVAAHELRLEFGGRVLAFGLKAGGIAHHFLKIIEIGLVINAIRTLSALLKNNLIQ